MTTVLNTHGYQQITLDFSDWLARQELKWIKASAVLDTSMQLPKPVTICCIGGSHTRYYDQAGTIVDIATPQLDNLEVLGELIIRSVNQDTKSVLISFAFPLVEGVLVRGAKDHPLVDLVGKNIKLELESRLYATLSRPIIVQVYNDLVLQSCMVSDVSRDTITGVVGTGFNLAVIKDDELLVVEPSGYMMLHPITHQTVSIETMVGGKYLYQLYNTIVEEPAQVVSTQELSTKIGYSAEARQVIECSANLVAALISSLIKQYHIKPSVIAIEGSTFWEVPQYASIAEESLKVIVGNADISIVRPVDQLTSLSALFAHKKIPT